MDFRINNMHRIERENSNLLAVCEIILNECFVVKGVQVMNSSKGRFVKMPSVKGRDEQYRDVAFPITKEARQNLDTTILKTYEKICQMEQRFRLDALTVKTYPVEGKENFKGYASVNIYDMFAINGIKIMEGKKGLFVSMPSWMKKDGTYGDFCSPLTKDAAQVMEDAILLQYEKDLKRDREAAKPEKSEQKEEERKDDTVPIEEKKIKQKKQERSR